MVSAIPWDKYCFMCGYDGSFSYEKSTSFSFISGDMSGEITKQECNFRSLFSRPEDWPKPFLFDEARQNPQVPIVIQSSKLRPPEDWLLGDWLGIDWLVDQYSRSSLHRLEIIQLAREWEKL
tara:strand:- start:1384 stop:1749 length:366 start_codon:yes stop_codon:yes gene_type:complete